MTCLDEDGDGSASAAAAGKLEELEDVEAEDRRRVNIADPLRVKKVKVVKEATD